MSQEFKTVFVCPKVKPHNLFINLFRFYNIFLSFHQRDRQQKQEKIELQANRGNPSHEVEFLHALQ